MSYLRIYIRAINVLMYWVTFVILISILPIIVQFYLPLQRYLIGLYHDLSAWDLFIVSTAGGIAVWSLMITQALIIDGVEARFLLSNDGAQNYTVKAFGRQPLKEFRLIPAWLEKLLNFPITWGQIIFYFALALPGLVIVIASSETSWLLALFASAAGILLAFSIMFILTLPAFWAGETTLHLSDLFTLTPKLQQTWHASKDKKRLLFLRRLLTWPIKHLRMNYLLEDSKNNQLLVSSHFLALVTIALLLAWYFLIQLVIRPPSPLEFPAVAHLLILITLLIWLIQGLEFHLSLHRIPTYFVLIVLIVGLQWLRQSDYYFAVTVREQPLAERLTPADVAASSGQNLVIVTSTGGGILAAGWTTQSLQKLITARPELAQEIRLISAASGGSVGAAFYINELLTSATCQPSPELLQQIHDKSVASSLSAAAYGFSFIDFWTILAGGPLFAKTDRGRLLDERWAINAGGTAAKSPLMGDFQANIKSGCIPAPILNTTVMENGRRLMITPIDFATAGSKRAMTFSEYLFTHDRDHIFDYTDTFDVNLWTAARLSATFPYISPAVRADLRSTALATATVSFSGHHFLDGGYYDNYGVASAIDWLDAVLEERARVDTQLGFTRVLIIQLRVSPTGDARYAPSSSGYSAAFLGPLIGLFQIREGAAYSRNENELHRFMKAWRMRLSNILIDTVIIEPTFDADLPLSWHLTQAQIDSLRTISWHITLDTCVTEINRFLSGQQNELSITCREGRYQ